MTYSKINNFNNNSQELAKFCKVLSHPARIEIIRYLVEQEQCISGDITSKIPLSRTTVSQHLRELKNARIIKSVVSGKKVYYCLTQAVFERCKKVIVTFFDQLD